MVGVVLNAKPPEVISVSDYSTEYVELCRRLALPREWRIGDSFAILPANSKLEYDAVDAAILTVATGQNMELPEFTYTWLPREGDLLDLIRHEIDPIMIDCGFVHLTWDEEVTASAGMLIDSFPNRWEAKGADALTALLKLYAAVKGIDL